MSMAGQEVLRPEPLLERYHAVARLLADCGTVLEIEPGDHTGTRIVKRVVRELIGTTWYPYDGPAPIAVYRHDFHKGPFSRPAASHFGEEPWFDAAFVLETDHLVTAGTIPQFLDNVVRSLADDGALVVGCSAVRQWPLQIELDRRFRKVSLFSFEPPNRSRLFFATGKR